MPKSQKLHKKNLVLKDLKVCSTLCMLLNAVTVQFVNYMGVCVLKGSNILWMTRVGVQL